MAVLAPQRVSWYPTIFGYLLQNGRLRASSANADPRENKVIRLRLRLIAHVSYTHEQFIAILKNCFIAFKSVLFSGQLFCLVWTKAYFFYQLSLHKTKQTVFTRIEFGK